MSHFGTYEDRSAKFDWSFAEQELDYTPGGVINIGWHCTDRICQKGLGNKKALIWEGSGAEPKTYT